MTDLETLLTRVWSRDTRPLVEEAWRCYNAGAIRASIAATWTAITADITAKLVLLADDGDAGAVAFRAEVASAQEMGIRPDGVRVMQNIEAGLLAKAAEFELIDSIGQRELDRIREDRNLCVHPSLRRFGEIYEPRPEQARGHLAVALTTLLIYPPTQGRKIVEAFQDYTCDPSFVPAASHIRATFFDHVRTNARANLTKLAAKHALRELDPNGRLPAIEYADRSAVVLSAFAEQDRELVRTAVVAQREHFQRMDGAAQLRAFVRLGDQDYFWDIVDDALAERLHGLIDVRLADTPALHTDWIPLPTDVAASLALVASSYARHRLPALEQRFDALAAPHRMNVVAMRPARYFVPSVLRFLTEARTYRIGEQAGQLLVQHAPFLTNDDLPTALENWAGNPQCREAAQMPELAVTLLHSTGHLGPARVQAFADFLAAVQSQAKEGDSYYRYPALEEALRAAGNR